MLCRNSRKDLRMKGCYASSDRQARSSAMQKLKNYLYNKLCLGAGLRSCGETIERHLMTGFIAYGINASSLSFLTVYKVITLVSKETAVLRRRASETLS